MPGGGADRDRAGRAAAQGLPAGSSLCGFDGEDETPGVEPDQGAAGKFRRFQRIGGGRQANGLKRCNGFRTGKADQDVVAGQGKQFDLAAQHVDLQPFQRLGQQIGVEQGTVGVFPAVQHETGQHPPFGRTPGRMLS